MQNYITLIRYIVEKTQMNVCLIPHVIWEKSNDLETIDTLYKKFVDTGRVCKVSDCNAMELKGYISRCRFFVGARTHATIAAYSSCVPTLVVGYSVKSRGIAHDLFGTDEHYVVPVQNLKSDQELKEHFMWLVEKEKSIRASLEAIMPEYKRNAEAARDAFSQMLTRC